MKEIKIKLHHIEDGKCIEIWTVEPQKNKPNQYVSRDTHGLNEWYWLCDAPYGYCEKDYPCSKEIIFIICDQNWTPLMSDSNDRTQFPESFLTLEDTCIKAWNNIKHKYPRVTRKGCDEWILRQNPEPFQTEVEKDNWILFDQKTIKEEILSEFTYLGRQKAIIRLTLQHTKCEARWYQYYAGNTTRTQYESFDKFLGEEYEENTNQ